jgi:PAS domain-containing protein
MQAMKLDKRALGSSWSSWSFILIVIVFIFIVELTEEWISPIFSDRIKLDHLNAIFWIALSAPFIWWLVKYRNRFQEEQLESEARFRSVVQTANDAIILADSHGNIVSWKTVHKPFLAMKAGRFWVNPYLS